jgi:Carbohydrate binding domain
MTARYPLVLNGTSIQEVQTGDTLNSASGAELLYSGGALGTPASGVLDNCTISNANGGPLAGFRNFIINGNMDIAQRGTAAVTANGAFGPADMFQLLVNGDTASVTQGAFVSGDTLFDTGGAQYYTQVAVTSAAGAGNYAILIQAIENVRLLAGKTVTVSFWAKAASGTPQIGCEITQAFGSGGSPSALITGTGQVVTLSTTWTKYSQTFTLLSINGKTLGTDVNSSYTQLLFWLDAGATYNTRSGSIGQASKTVSIAQVQCEVGTVATPFEHRPIGAELALCKRYYETSSQSPFPTVNAEGNLVWAHAYSTNMLITASEFKVEKRAVPTIRIASYAGTLSKVSAIDNGSDAATGALGIIRSSKERILTINMTSGLTAASEYWYQWEASAEL